jgi:hypothetical protein
VDVLEWEYLVEYIIQGQRIERKLEEGLEWQYLVEYIFRGQRIERGGLFSEEVRSFPAVDPGLKTLFHWE